MKYVIKIMKYTKKKKKQNKSKCAKKHEIHDFMF